MSSVAAALTAANTFAAPAHLGPQNALLAQAGAAAASAPGKKFIAMQLSAQSFVDEGVDNCLEILQQKGGVNVIMPTAYSYGWEPDGRQVHERPLPDHGA